MTKQQRRKRRKVFEGNVKSFLSLLFCHFSSLYIFVLDETEGFGVGRNLLERLTGLV